ncbi:MAG: DUF4147 domain-containing protein [Gammaproteobacteria bacterium]|nr:DUF4147 domain-containing protein [Gammaproteobacteria bacterium]
MFQVGLDRVGGQFAVRDYLEKLGGDGDYALVAVGKAAGAMALGAADALGDRLAGGIVISKPGHFDEAQLEKYGLRGLEGSHPVPSEKSLESGRAMLAYLAELPPGQPLLFLVSGGTSSLVEVLNDGVTLDDLQNVNRWLLANGFQIGQINRVRKSLSRIKGGGLLQYLGERPVLALMISDVPADDPAVIGSGMLVPDVGAREELAALQLPDWIRDLTVSDKDSAAIANTNVDVQILATLRDAREAAAEEARRLGYETRVSHAFISAEAENAGRRFALELVDALPGVYVWGGEPSVQLPDNPGRGGRNQHLALAAATVLEDRDDVCFLSGGTDGTDGPGEDAGALVDGGTIGRGRRQGFEAGDMLNRADSGTLLDASGDLLHTGPTGTNVMDLMIGIKIGA